MQCCCAVQTLSWFFYELSRNEGVEQRVIDEIEKQCTDGMNVDGKLSFEDMRKCTYLE